MSQMDDIHAKIAAGEAGQYEAAILWQKLESLMTENAGLLATPASTPVTVEAPKPCQCGDGGCIECWPSNFTKERLIEELNAMRKKMRAATPKPIEDVPEVLEETKYKLALKWIKMLWKYGEFTGACGNALLEDGELKELLREADRIG